MIETLRQIDHQLFHFVNQTMANSFLDAICPILRAQNTLTFLYLMLGLSLCRLYPKDFLKIFLAGAVTFLLTDQLSAHFIKSLVHRIRPCNNPEINARLVVQYCGSGFSFVSAHAANSFGMAAFVSSLPKNRTRSIITLGLWATLVSFSQVYVGVHFPADVIGGAILGILIGAITGIILKTKFDLQSTTS